MTCQVVRWKLYWPRGAIVLVAIGVATSVGESQSSRSVPGEMDIPAWLASSVKPRSQQRISLNFKEVPIEKALHDIAAQAGLALGWSQSKVPLSGSVSAVLKNVTVEEGLVAVLSGTGAEARLSSDRQTILIVATKGDSTVTKRGAKTVGVISGSVVDSVTGKGVGDATVTIVGTKRSTVTNANGAFRFQEVDAGTYTVMVKLFGFRSASRSVTVDEGKAATVRFRLVATPTELSGVVTTATGTQRKIEVGNDITTINVDSVIKLMPVSTFTDLLATRVPGLTVSPTSGAPGAPSKIRIRGVSSINASNDPIVIVDGIRINDAQTGSVAGYRNDRSQNMAGDENRTATQLVSSPLDAIDPNSIETVEVFKGPSAVALYGTDAANGVIVVTTKRGNPGPVRWTVDGIWGQTTMPGRWPANYVRLGTDLSGYIVDCSSRREATSIFSGGCRGLEGSLIEYQILNDPHTTVFGTGTKRTYRMTADGGRSNVSYFVSGSFGDEVGYLQMPDIDVRMLGDQGSVVPAWQRKPQGSESQSGLLTVRADLGQRDGELTFDITSGLTRTTTRTTPLQGAATAAGTLGPTNVDTSTLQTATVRRWASIGSGILGKIPRFRAQTISQKIVSRNSLRVMANPKRWLNTELIGGLEVTNGKDVSTLGRGECSTVFGGNCSLNDYNDDNGVSHSDAGVYNTAGKSTIVPSIRVRASMSPISMGRLFSLRPTVGGDYKRDMTFLIRREARGLPSGATSGNGAAFQATNEASDTYITAGMYAGMLLGIADRMYLPFEMRLDVGSGLGANVRPTYPRISPSFLLSDLPVFRSLPVIGRLETVRLRAAYGRSGVQPTVSQRFRTYAQQTGIVGGLPVQTTEIASLGNARLRPERSSEIEGGADIDMLNGRFGIKVTGYKRHTLDALVSIDVPLSVNGGGPQLRNVGTVDNVGMELDVNATILQSRPVNWQVNLGLSKQQNTLVKLGRDSLIGVLGRQEYGVKTRFVEGYPLFGQWALPIVGFADLNQDGWITTGVTGAVDEVQVGTQPVYLGAPYPEFESSMHNTLTFFRDISVGFTFNYQHGLTQKNEGATIGFNGLENRRPLNDPTTPLATQASLATALTCIQPGSTCKTGIGLIQTVSTLRLRDFSIVYRLPRRLTAPISRGRTIRVAVQGTNLGLWTNYKGKDPNVNDSMSEVVRDSGILPTPRLWQITIGVN